MPNDQNKPAATPETPATPAAATDGGDSLDGGAAPTPSLTPADPGTANTPPPKKGGLRNLPIFKNIWLVVFILVVLSAGGVVYVAIQSAKPTTTVSKAGTLTDQQLASLKGNTTLVGDAKQTLDVQSNSIFEGAVLLRSDLSVAGSLKVGSGISIPSITVGGNGSFGQIGISGGLNVGNDASIQGNLTVQKNITVNGTASFANLSVATLGVTTLQLRGDINLNQHINASGGVPGRTLGTAVGGGGTASISGSDTAGTVNISTGTSPPAGCFISVSFAHSFSATPHVVLTPTNSNAAGLQYYANRTNAGFSVCVVNVPTASTNYVFDYIVIN